MKRIACTLLVALLLISCAVSPYADTTPTPDTDGGEALPFPDIASHYARADILWGVEQALVFGMEDGTFSPDAPLTRAMFVTLLGRVSERLGFRMTGYTDTDRFSDVRHDAWYIRYVAWGAVNALAAGYGDGTFGPADTLTREQMAALLYRFCALWVEDRTLRTDADAAYTDAAQIAAYAQAPVNTMTAAGLLQGTPEQAFLPQKACTRAEAVVVLHALSNYLSEHNLPAMTAFMKNGINIYSYRAALSSKALRGSTVTDFLARQGIDFVRLPLNVMGGMSYDTDDAGHITYHLPQSTVDNALAVAKNFTDAGFTVILEMHDIRYAFEYRGLDWNTGLGLSLFSAMWGAFAACARDLPENVIFELQNEAALTTACIEATADAIRATGGNNATRMLMVYSYYWHDTDEIVSLGKYESDPNFMWDIHNYEPYTYSNGESHIEYEDVGTRLRLFHSQMSARLIMAGKLQRSTGRKVIIGEYGVRMSRASRRAYLLDYKQLALQNSITSLCTWSSTEDIQRRITLCVYGFETGQYDPVTFDAIFGRPQS